MSFTHPMLLLLLVPWTGLVAHLLVGRRTLTQVPFVQLWRGMKGAPRVKRFLQPPPRAVVLILLSLLLAIVASAGPTIHSHAVRGNLVVVVDNGATLLPPGRLRQLVSDAGRELWSRFGFCDITLMTAVGDDVTHTDASDLGGLGGNIPAFPIDTTEVLQTKIARLLQDQAAPIVILSDRKIRTQSDRVFQIAPAAPVANVSIVDVSVREWPLGQLMLRVRNDSPLVDAAVEIVTGQIIVQQKVDLPPPGEMRDYFFDLPEVGAQLQVVVTAADDFATDNRATLIRVGANPRLEIRGNVEPSVRRMVEVYTRHRPTSDASEGVMVCESLFQLPDSRAVAAVSSASALQALRGPLQVEMNHPVLREMDWKSVDRATVAGTSPGDGWTPVVRSNDLVLVAVRESPARQVWVGFYSAGFEASRDFVILWTNIFDYLGEGGVRISYEKVGPLAAGAPPPREPGIYQRADGSHVAMNLVDVRFHPDPQSLTRLPATASRARSAGIRLSPWLALLAMTCLLAGALSFKR